MPFVVLCSIASKLVSHNVCISGLGTVLIQCSGLKCVLNPLAV